VFQLPEYNTKPTTATMASNIFELLSNSFDTFGMFLTNLNKFISVLTTMLVLYIIVSAFFLSN
jgi:hypothetical protein